MACASVCSTLPGRARGSVILGATRINSLATHFLPLESSCVLSSQIPFLEGQEGRKGWLHVIPILQVRMTRVTVSCLLWCGAFM